MAAGDIHLRANSVYERSALPMHRSAKVLFAEEDAKNRTQLKEDLKDFMLNGTMVRLVRKKDIRPRHLFLTSDLECLVWKNVKKSTKDYQKMKVWKIHAVEKGLASPELNQKRLFGSPRDECSFVLTGADVHSNTEKNLSFVEENEELRDKWVECIQHLIEYAEHMKMFGTDTVQMTANALVVKPNKGHKVLPTPKATNDAAPASSKATNDTSKKK